MGEIRTLFVWLTREELMAVYGFQWAAHVYPAYGAEQMSVRERDEIFESLGSAMRWGIRELINRGFRFTALGLDTRGELVITQPEAPCMENAVLFAKIARGADPDGTMGRMLNPIVAIKTALDEFEKQGVVVDRGPMVDVLLQCEQDSNEAKALFDEDPDTAQAMDRFFKGEVAKLGFQVIPRKEELN